MRPGGISTYFQIESASSRFELPLKMVSARIICASLLPGVPFLDETGAWIYWIGREVSSTGFRAGFGRFAYFGAAPPEAAADELHATTSRPLAHTSRCWRRSWSKDAKAEIRSSSARWS